MYTVCWYSNCEVPIHVHSVKLPARRNFHNARTRFADPNPTPDMFLRYQDGVACPLGGEDESHHI